MEQAVRPATFVVPGDLHLTDAEQTNYRVAQWTVGQINTLVRPDFVQFIGDNAQEARPEQYQLFKDLCARLTVPYDVLVGDHDVHKDPKAQAFQRFVGETYGNRLFPGVRFVRLNTQEAKPQGISEAQIAWFAEQVDAVGANGEQVVVFQHNYPYQIWENYDGPCHVVSGRDHVRVRTWSDRPITEVRYRVDGRDWMVLSQLSEGEWQGDLSVSGLTKCTHLLEVEARDAERRIGRQQQTFVFDPTGRYTPVPTVRPLIRQTKFC